MVWRLSCGDHYCSLEPREQKRTKRGGWTKGRPVSLERLYQQQDAFDYLSPQDRRICRQIEAETVYEYYGHYPRTVYSLDGDQALLEAIGHPLLFWADDPEQPGGADPGRAGAGGLAPQRQAGAAACSPSRIPRAT